MYLKMISLCQNEDEKYNYPPIILSSDYNSSYNFAYPLSYNLALDCERIVYKLKEYDIQSDICNQLNVTFINGAGLLKAGLSDYVAYNRKNMRYVNVPLCSDDFNSLDDNGKRKVLIYKILEALNTVLDEKYNHLVKEICDEVYQHSDETECVYKNKITKRFNIEVRFKSSLNGYSAILYVIDCSSNAEFRYVLFENGSLGDLEYRINTICIKGNTCVINPKSSERFNDEPMKIEIGM